MAYLKLYNPGINKCDFEVDLSNPFDKNNYQKLRITSTYYGTSTSDVSSYVENRNAPLTDGDDPVKGVVDEGMSEGGEYTLRAYVLALNGTWYLAGSDTITMHTAREISVNSSINGSIGVEGDVDYFKLTTNIEGTYKIYTTGNLDTIGELEDSSGDMLEENDDGGEDRNFKIQYTLSEDTAYYIRVSGYEDATGDYTLHVDAPIPDSPSAPKLDYRIEGGFEVKWDNVTNADGYRLKITDYNSTLHYPSSSTYTSNTSYEVSGLKYGVTYNIFAMAHNNTGSSPYSNYSICTTAPKTPSAFVSETTTNSISIYVSGMEGNFDNINITVWKGISSNGTKLGTKVITRTNYNSGYRTTTFNNLTQDEDYYFEVQSNFYINQTTLWSVGVAQLHSKTSGRPEEDWEWTATELNAFNNNGSIASLTYSRWNEFINKVNEFRRYKGCEDDIPATVNVPDIGTVNTKMSSADKTLYAERFNVVRKCIDDMSSTGIGDKQRGDKVNGDYFITMSNSLKSIE